MWRDLADLWRSLFYVASPAVCHLLPVSLQSHTYPYLVSQYHGSETTD